MEKKINIGVNKQEYDSVMRGISTDSRRISTEMIRSAISQEKSSKDVLASLREQLKLLQEKQRILRDTEKSELLSRYQRGEISEGKFGAGQAVIQARSERDDRVVKELKNVISAIVSSSKEQIREDRRNVEGRINELRRTNRVGSAGADEFENLRNIVQDNEISQSTNRRRLAMNPINPMQGYGMGEQLGSGSIPMGAASMFGGRAANLISSNPYTAIGALALLATIGAAFAGEKSSSSSTNEYFRVLGSGNTGLGKDLNLERMKSGYDVESIGVDPTSTFGNEAKLMRVSGGRRISYDQLIKGLSISKSRDISEQDLESLMGVSRYYSQQTQTPFNTIGGFEKFLDSIGRPIAQLPEMLSAYLTVSNSILSRQGSVNDQGVRNLVTGVMSSYGAEGENINRYTEAFSFAGSRRNKVAGMSHMQIRAARRVLGQNASLLDIDLLRDDPSHEKYGEYMSEIANEARRMRGGGEGAVRVMEQIFPSLGLKEINEKISKRDFTIPATPSSTEVEEKMNSYFDQAKGLTTTVDDWKKETGTLLKQISINLSQILEHIR